jgi:hypothetical protein
MERSSARQALDMAAPAVVLVGLLFSLRAASQTPDGLSYAVAVRTGLDMFHPHHMIYVPVARASAGARSQGRTGRAAARAVAKARHARAGRQVSTLTL